MKRSEFNEQQQARLTTRILTNSRIFRHARILVIYNYNASSRGLIARRFGSSTTYSSSDANGEHPGHTEEECFALG